MSTSTTEAREPIATNISIQDDELSVDLYDGRRIAVPLAWYPRLLHATPVERLNYRLIGNGQGIHWPDLEEDISVEALLSGRASAEGGKSLQRWLAGRTA